jgi:formamidopyrimidine-DNA glycosylase
LTEDEVRMLYQSVVETITQMMNLGGRNTEKSIFGQSGGYQTVLNAKTYKNPCPKCAGVIAKEQYLGGAIYYCPICQK